MRRPELTAIIYDKKGRVLSIGKNSYVKTHPLQGYYAARTSRPERVFLHAEIAAIVRCRNLDAAFRMHVFLFDLSGKPKLAKPCEICQSAIQATPIRVVQHT